MKKGNICRNILGFNFVMNFFRDEDWNEFNDINKIIIR